MSGKKSCEVASVLNQTENIQKEIFGSYEQNINKNIKSIDNMNSSLKDNKKEIVDFELGDVRNIEDELPSDIDNIKKKLKSIKNDINKINTSDTSRLIKQLNNIKNSLNAENKKANSLREQIRRSSHYMDSEYAQAQQVKTNITKLKQEFQQLKHSVNKEKDNVNYLTQQVKSKINDLNYIKEEKIKLNKQAKKIKDIRDQADKLKDDISKNIKNLDMQKIKKFVEDDYVQLEKDLLVFKSLNDKDTIKQYAKLLSSITKLESDSEELYNKWLAKKTYTEELLLSTASDGLKEELVTIENLVNDVNIKISKLSYYDNYSQTKTKEEFESLLSQSKKLLDNEDFEKSNEIINQAKQLHKKISDKTDTLREHIEASANLSFKIRDIMLSDAINFRTAHLEIIDDNPMNGFRLECQNGDTINFEEIRFDDEGKLILNLDHIENTNGTCGIRWKSMQKVFNENGIPLTDVVKDGNSVIYKDKRKIKKESKIQRRGN